MIFADESHVAMKGTKIGLQVQLIQVMRAMNEKGIVNKETLHYLVDLACKSDAEVENEGKELLGTIMKDAIDVMGEDKAGEFFRMIMEGGKE